MSRLAALNDDYSTDELALIADYQRRAAEIQTAAAVALTQDGDPRWSSRPSRRPWTTGELHNFGDRLRQVVQFTSCLRRSIA